MLPREVTLTNEGLGLLRDSYQNLAGKTDEIIARAVDFVQRNKVQGLLVTGGFVTLFNPGWRPKSLQLSVFRFPAPFLRLSPRCAPCRANV
jgi:hypothetical protein